ncbi:MAG: Lrp/AsnC family transcriptional regulator [Myxococcota bacterium]
MAPPTDELDEKILRALEEDAWLTYSQLGDRVGLSPSATQRRVARLKRSRVLLGARALVNPAGRRQRIYLLMTLNEDSRKGVRSVRSLLLKAPGFVDAHLVIGESDIIATFDCTSVEEFSAWAMSTVHDHPNVRHCYTYVSLQTLSKHPSSK